MRKILVSTFCVFSVVSSALFCDEPVSLKKFLSKDFSYDDVECGELGEFVKDGNKYLQKMSSKASESINLNWYKNNAPNNSWYVEKPSFTKFPIDRVFENIRSNFNLHLDRKKQPFHTFFVEKHIVSPYAKIIITSDQHAYPANETFEKLVDENILDNDRKVKDLKTTYFAFLGDYTDKGESPLFLLSTVLKKHNENPRNVFVLRGNHEDIANAYFDRNQSTKDNFYPILKDFIYDGFDFKKNSTTEVAEEIEHYLSFFRKHLPVSLYLGFKGNSGKTNYIQLCHGGPEIGYNPYPFLNSDSTFEKIDIVNRNHFFKKFEPIGYTQTEEKKIKKLCKEKFDDDLNSIIEQFYAQIDKDNLETICDFSDGYWGKRIYHGYMWTKFLTEDFADNHPGLLVSFKASQSLSKEQTEYLLNPETWDFNNTTSLIIALIGGHQHNNNDKLKDRNKNKIKNMMYNKTQENKGYYKQWGGLVSTIISSPLLTRKLKAPKKPIPGTGYESFLILQLNPDPGKITVTHYYRLETETSWEKNKQLLFG